jgi:hypothetical protein
MTWSNALVNTSMLAGRVGMLVHSYYLRDVRVRREAEALAAAGAEVHVVCIREPIQSARAPEPRQEVRNDNSSWHAQAIALASQQEI